MSSVLDDKNRKKLTNQPATTTTTAQPTANAQGGESVKWKGKLYRKEAGGGYVGEDGKRYQKVNFDEIPNNRKAARNAGYPIYRNPNGDIIGTLNQGVEANNIGNYYTDIKGEWYEVVDNPIATAAGRTFKTAQPTAAVTNQPATTTTAAQPAAQIPAPAAVATEAASQKEKTPAAPDTQASDDVVALEEVDIFGKRSHKKAPETTFPKNVRPFDSAGTRIPTESARNAGVSKRDNYYHRSVLETLPETLAAQSRYDKVIADIGAAKSPSRRERRDIRKMEKAAKKLIEDGKIRIETEPIVFERDPVADKNPTPQTPAKETSTPAAQSTATTTQQEAAKDEVMVQPASTAQQPASEETPEQMTYTELLKRFYPVMTPEEKAEQQRRQRNRQIINAVGDGISALANLYYTNKSGVNAYDPSTSLTKAAKERYDKLLAQQREDDNRYKELAYRSGAADLEMAYKRARDAKADADAEVEAGYKEREEAREIAESNARIKKEEALTKHYESLANINNNGGKTKTGSKSSTTNKPYLIGDDGKAVYYDSVQAAFAILPPEYKRRAETLEEKKQAIANYNTRKRSTAKTSSNKNGGNKTNGKTMPGVGSNKTMPGVK